MMRIRTSVIVGFLAACCCAVPAFAGSEAPETAAGDAEPSAAANANNPLADMRAFNLHNYYIPELSGLDENANTFWLRYAQPFGRWLFRGSLPVSRVPAGSGTSTSGLGDFNAFVVSCFVCLTVHGGAQLRPAGDLQHRIARLSFEAKK